MKSFDAIYEAASGNFGFVIAGQSREMGVSSHELSRWVRSGCLDHAGRGVYRVSNFPASQYDAFATAVEFVGEDGVPVVGWNTQTSPSRTYKVFGKVDLDDSVWIEVKDNVELDWLFKVNDWIFT